MQNIGKYFLIALLGILLFVPFLGNVHLFDWDEINFAECAREMIMSDDYLQMQINFRPFWEKPPLFIWLQVLSMKLWGVNEFAARFPNAMIGVATLLSIYYAGKRLLNEKMALWWALLYIASWLPHLYFKSGIIDPTFNLFIFLSFLQFHFAIYSNRRWLNALLSGIFLGLAVLTKGPVAILVAAIALLVYFVVNKGLNGLKIKHLILLILAGIVTTSIWFGVEIYKHGWWFVNEFVVYQVRLFKTEDAGHGGPFIYHFIVLLVGCFPAAAFLFQYNIKQHNETVQVGSFTKWMWVMFWVVLLLFSIVKTKIVHYSSLCYFPLTYLAALQLYRISEGTVHFIKHTRAILLSIGILLGFVITMVPVVGINKHLIIPLIKDPFAVGNFQADVKWSYTEMLFGLIYISGIITVISLSTTKFRRSMLLLCVVQVMIIEVVLAHFTPKIEAFSQRAAIEYFKSFQGKDVYVHVLGYKSYAHLFYTDKQPPSNNNYDNEQWLLTGDIDKPAYFICKIHQADKYRIYTELKETGSKNGFVFFERVKPN